MRRARPERATAEVDAPKVERIVDNLLTNAITHTPKESEVQVAPVGDGVQISVDDNGRGVRPGA